MSEVKWASPATKKKVVVYGQTVEVLAYMGYTAVDDDGVLCAYVTEPTAGYSCWDAEARGDYTYLGLVYLGDTDWKTTLQEI